MENSLKVQRLNTSKIPEVSAEHLYGEDIV
nr:MAG TPA: hypothetical protein [Caudoviricetes sp.]